MATHRLTLATHSPQQLDFSAAMIVLAVLLLAPTSLHGWGSCGHRIVGDIAEHLVSDSTRLAVDQILGGEPMSTASLWADFVRPLPAYLWTGPYHYINIPEDQSAVDYARDCPERGCVLKGIEDALRHLGEPEVKPGGHAEALKFLLHYTGDLHQPLHVSNAADRGGNSIEVVFFGRETNLHSVWDSGMIERMRRRGLWKTTCSKYGKKLANGLQRSSMLDVPSELLTWADESLLLARSHAYPLTDGTHITKQYYENNRAIIETQLRLAGKRLAALLDQTFAQDPIPKTQNDS